jgi:hypothetical protein
MFIKVVLRIHKHGSQKIKAMILLFNCYFQIFEKIKYITKKSKLYQLFHENFKFLKVFEITWIDSSFIIIFSKKINDFLLWNNFKIGTVGSLKIQIIAQHWFELWTFKMWQSFESIFWITFVTPNWICIILRHQVKQERHGELQILIFEIFFSKWKNIILKKLNS